MRSLALSLILSFALSAQAANHETSPREGPLPPRPTGPLLPAAIPQRTKPDAVQPPPTPLSSLPSAAPTPVQGQESAPAAAVASSALSEAVQLGKTLADENPPPNDARRLPRLLGRFFDRRGEKEAGEGGEARQSPRSRRDAENERLYQLAAPWKTERQKEKLAQVPRPAHEPFRFVVIGDAEPGRFFLSRRLFNQRGVFRRFLSEAESHAPDFTVQLGDMVSRGTVPHFLEFFETLASAALARPYFTVLGNHDRHRPHGVTHDKVYRSLFGEPNYYFERGATRFVVFDTSAPGVKPDQLAWLDRALDTDLAKIVFTHKPPAPVKLWNTGRRRLSLGGFHAGAEEFTDIVSRRKVARVYMGHLHAFDVTEYKGVRYVLTGGGGSPLYPVGMLNIYHHYLTVEVGPDGIKETVHNAKGGSFPIP